MRPPRQSSRQDAAYRETSMAWAFADCGRRGRRRTRVQAAPAALFPAQRFAVALFGSCAPLPSKARVLSRSNSGDDCHICALFYARRMEPMKPRIRLGRLVGRERARRPRGSSASCDLMSFLCGG